jgi:hypothetical protein
MAAIPNMGRRPRTEDRRSALVNSIEHAIERAARESKLAYQFNPNSYTHGTLSAVSALRVLIKRLRDEEGL